MPGGGAPSAGLTPKLLEKLDQALGGRDAVERALEQGDVALLASVPGLSRQRAVRMVQESRGGAEWLRTDAAEALGEDALRPFLDRTVTQLGRATLETLTPALNRDQLKDGLKELDARLARLANVELAPVRRNLERVAPAVQPRPKPVQGLTVYLDEGPLLQAIKAEGLDRWLDVTTEPDAGYGGGLVLAATIVRAPRGSIPIPAKHAHEAVPWADLAFAEANRPLLEALRALQPLLDTPDSAGPILDALARVPPLIQADASEAARACAAEANKAAEAKLAQLTLTGRDLLDVIQGGTSAAVERAFEEARADARRRFRERTGATLDPFTDGYPIDVDPEALDAIERSTLEDQLLLRHRAAVQVAKAVREHRAGIDEMVRAAAQLDRWQAVALAARELGLTVPSVASRMAVAGALHLALAGKGDPVDYELADGVALLTGANSGGKTTLLEALGQVAYLAHLGLPVPARDAKVPLLDGLAYYARPRQLGAGAFEGFLRTIEPALLTKERVLVLADELEAMTELEAAGAILAEVVERLEKRKCPAVLVTHLAPLILKHATVRVDGIEAQGLDDRNELIVDRTPTIGKLARSTPELILQRLRNEAHGPRRELYEAMLARLAP